MFEFVETPSVVKTYYEKYQFANAPVTMDIDADTKMKVKLVSSQLNNVLRRMKKIQLRCIFCLNTIDRRCFADKCLHSFCTRCLIKWSDQKTTCPICGQKFGAIFYNVKSINSYKIRNLDWISQRQPCLVLCMKNATSFHNINENVSEILEKYKISVNMFCNTVAFSRWTSALRCLLKYCEFSIEYRTRVKFTYFRFNFRTHKCKLV